MNNLQVLMNGVFGRKVPAEFAAENYDYEAALHDELVKLLCDDNGKFNRYKFEKNKYDLGYMCLNESVSIIREADDYSDTEEQKDQVEIIQSQAPFSEPDIIYEAC